MPELEEREQLTIGNVASELEDRGSTGVTGTVSQADSAATKMLVAMIGAWAERNGHALAYAPKSVQVRVDGGDVLLSPRPVTR